MLVTCICTFRCVDSDFCCLNAHMGRIDQFAKGHVGWHLNLPGKFSEMNFYAGGVVCYSMWHGISCYVDIYSGIGNLQVFMKLVVLLILSHNWTVCLFPCGHNLLS